MELLCCEAGEHQKRAYLDPVFLNDNRVLQNLLKVEEHYTISSKYMDFQADIKSFMRKVVTQWMKEVCEEQRCEEEVFGLAVNFLDRFLATYSELRRNKLQLVASVCMFLASKLKETYPLSAEKLVIYTDNSITLQELLDWELLVLCKLKWDLSSVIPNDFVDLLLHRIDLPSDIRSQVRQNTLINISTCLLELEFIRYPASLLASGCICAALPTVLPYADSQTLQTYYTSLHKIVGVDLEILTSCQEIVHSVVVSSGIVLPAPPTDKSEPVSHPGTPTDTLAVEPN